MVERTNKPSALNAPTPSAPGPQVDIVGEGGSQKVVARLPSGESIEVLLFGATVTSWKSNGGQTENLWLSDAADVTGKKPVRGGIPVVFPVFGPPPKDGHATSSLPQHGFARASRWEYMGKSTAEDALDSNSVKLDFGLDRQSLSDESRKAWPLDFGLVYSVTLSKICVCFFFLRIFPMRGFRRFMYVLIGFSIVAAIAFTISLVFQCSPIHYAWVGFLGEIEGTCVARTIGSWMQSVINIVLDLIILIAPIWQLHQVQRVFPTKKKLQIFLMFSVGVIATIISVLRLISVVRTLSGDQNAMVSWNPQTRGDHCGLSR